MTTQTIPSWKKYQEDVASLFRSMGLSAETDVALQGVRTSHDIDVLVKSSHVGFEVTWLIECKFWNTPVSKLHVLALREIVTEVGADRGILICESGFQSGAIEAANLTNVRVSSISDLSLTARSDIYAMRLRELYDRIEKCEKRYWAIPKEDRIDKGLRPDIVLGGDYSSRQIIDECHEILSRAFRGLYPFRAEECSLEILNVEHAVNIIEPKIIDLERRLSEAENS